MEIHHVATQGRWSRTPENYAVLHRIVATVPEGTSVSPWLRHYTDAIVSSVSDAVAMAVQWIDG